MESSLQTGDCCALGISRRNLIWGQHQGLEQGRLHCLVMQGAAEPLRQRRALSKILCVHGLRHGHLLQLHGIDAARYVEAAEREVEEEVADVGEGAHQTEEGALALQAPESWETKLVRMIMTEMPTHMKRIDCVKATSSSEQRFPRRLARNPSSGSIAQVAQQSLSLETLSTLPTSSPRLTLWGRSSPQAPFWRLLQTLEV